MSHTNFKTIGVSDASSTSYAVNLTIKNVQYDAYKSLSEEESQKGFTWRDILVVEFASKAVVHLLKNSSVLRKTDKYDLQKTVENTYYFCKEDSIILKVMWIPREELSSVDRQSKIIDHDDWRTKKPFLRYLIISGGHWL